MSPAVFVDEAAAYALLARAGLHPPRHGVVGALLPFAAGEPVVLKGLGENVWHKSELGAVRFLPFDAAVVAREAAGMRARLEAQGHRWIDALVCDRIPTACSGPLPVEAFVSLARGEAGWTVLVGFGGLPAEAMAELSPPLRWPVAVTPVAQALAELEAHLLGRIWLGRVRGAEPLTSRDALGQFLTAVWELAAVSETAGLSLLELNPVALDATGLPRPLDAVGCRGVRPAARLAPPEGFLTALRAPRRIALAGVSATAGGVGRTILENLRRGPLPARDLVLLKPGHGEFLGHPCVADVAALREDPVDLLLLALPAPVAAETLAQLIDQGGGARCVGLVAGGIGDGADHAGLGARLAARLHDARAAGRWTPAVLGPNFLGHWVPGRQLDSSFIPADRLAPPDASPGELTLLSQSGAFLLSRRSRQPALAFRLGLALGNQMDVALGDVLGALATEAEGGPVAAYVEGFGTGQLLPAARAIGKLDAQGRLVLLHRAGRTAFGQAAAASHTGAMASDLALERALLERAGARFTETMAEFDAALTWLGAWPGRPRGPVAVLSNAGFESVCASDLFGPRLPAAQLDEAAQSELRALLAAHEIAGLVAPRLPLDLTPMADDAAFVAAGEFLLQHAGVLVVGLVPFTRRLDSSPAGATRLAGEFARLSQARHQAIAVAVDAGADYADYRRAFTAAGLPVFDRIESALLGLRVLA